MHKENTVNDFNKRRHVRFRHQAKIKLVTPFSSDTFIVDMKDCSESGLFLFSLGQFIPPVGSIVEVQTTEFEDAPVQKAKVIRIDDGVGFGVEFCLEPKS